MFYIDEEGRIWTRDELKVDHASLVTSGALFDEMTDFDAYLEEASGRNGTLQWVSKEEAQRIKAMSV